MIVKRFLVVFSLLTLSFGAWAQQDTIQQPVTVIGEEVEPAVKKKKHSPGKAALFSAILPGAGQVYNKKYWKLPIIYGGFAALGYYIGNNTKNYKIYRDEFNSRTDENPYTVPDPGLSNLSDGIVRSRKDTYSRWRDWSIFFTGLLYALNVLDAYVDAHLMDFNVGKDFLLTLDPHAAPVSPNSLSLGLSLNLRLKNNPYISR